MTPMKRIILLSCTALSLFSCSKQGKDDTYKIIYEDQSKVVENAKAIKEKIFKLSREKYPNAKIFGLTTGLAVMKINSELGYEPVTYSELTQDDPDPHPIDCGTSSHCCP